MQIHSVYMDKLFVKCCWPDTEVFYLLIEYQVAGYFNIHIKYSLQSFNRILYLSLDSAVRESWPDIHEFYFSHHNSEACPGIFKSH